jgi:hypothetical protein
MKAFLMLAAPDEHPFWTADEEEAPVENTVVSVPRAGMVLGRAPGNVVALVAQRSAGWSFLEQTEAKYKKFAYSSRFGFSGDFDAGFGAATTDSMLQLTDPATGERRVRNAVVLAEVADGLAYARWFPFPDVRVDTVLCGGAPWHARLHRVTTDRQLVAVETGFALPFEPEGFGPTSAGTTTSDGVAVAMSPWGCSAICALAASEGEHRSGEVRSLPPNSNLMFPHTEVPALVSVLEPGEHLLACAVGASGDHDEIDPEVPMDLPDSTHEMLRRMASMPTADTDARG